MNINVFICRHKLIQQKKERNKKKERERARAHFSIENTVLFPHAVEARELTSSIDDSETMTQKHRQRTDEVTKINFICSHPIAGPKECL